MASDGQEEIAYALVSLKTGALLRRLGGPPIERVEGLAAAAPELLGSADAWTMVFEHLGGDGGNDGFREIVLISQDHVHILERLPGQPDVALLAASVGTKSLSEVLSSVRAELARIRAA